MVAFAVILSLLALSTASVAQSVPPMTWSTNIQISDSPGIQSNWPRVAATGDMVHSVWAEGTSSPFNLYYNRSFDGGNSWDTPRLLTTNARYNYALVADGDVVVIFWETTSGAQEVIQYILSADAGTTWSADQEFSSPAEDIYSLEADAKEGRIVCFWSEVSGSSGLAKMRLSNDDGQNWGSTLDVATFSYNPSYGSFIDGTIAGSVLIVAINEGFPANIKTVSSIDWGQTWSSPVTVHSTTYQLRFVYIDAYEANAVIRWGQHYGAYNSEAYVAASGDAGLTWSEPTLTSIPSSGSNSYGDVCISGTRAVVMWINNAGTGPLQPYYSRSLDGGQTWEDAALITMSGISHFDVPRCTATGSLVYIIGYSTDAEHDIWLFRGEDPVSPGAITFQDDFEDASIDPGKWHQRSGAGTVGESEGYLKLDYRSEGAPHWQIRTIDDLMQDDFTVRFKIKPVYIATNKNIGFWFGDINVGALTGFQGIFHSTDHYDFAILKYHNYDGWDGGTMSPSEGGSINLGDGSNFYTDHEVVITKEEDTYSFYIDGEFVARDYATSTHPTALYFSLGRPWMENRQGEYGEVWLNDILVEADHSAVTVSLPEVTATYDESIQIPVRINHSGNQEIVSTELFVSFSTGDSGGLLPVFSSGISAMEIISGWSLESNVVFSDAPTPDRIDTLKMAMATDDEPIGNTGGIRDLLMLSFQVADIRHPATTPLTLEHVLFNDGVPGYIATNGSITLVGTNGSIDSDPDEIIPRWPIQVTVTDIDEDRNTGSADTFEVRMTNGSQTETIIVTETGNSTGLFEGSIATVFSLGSTSGDGVVQARAGDQIVFCYDDSLDAAGNTEERCATTDVIGGTDGQIRTTIVAQAGDTVRVRVTDDDLVDAVIVPVENPRTLEVESILLSAFSPGSSVFYERAFTEEQAGGTGDNTLQVARYDSLVTTYADTLTVPGGTSTLTYATYITLFGDCDGNDQRQAFDAARLLLYVLLHPDPPSIDTLACNLDIDAPFSPVTPYDASLILQYIVGLIGRFPVQMPQSANHPQPETTIRPKVVPDERVLTLQTHEGYVSVWLDERSGIVAGELMIEGIDGQVEMGKELAGFLSASRAREESLRIVFAGAEGVSGPGELLRVYGVGFADAQLTRADFNDGSIVARIEETVQAPSTPLAFALHPNHPNPFNPETTIRYDMPHASDVRLEVYDVLGQRVRVLVAAKLPAGVHQVLWDGRNEVGVRVGSGVYFYRLQAGDFAQVQRMLLLK